MPGQFRLDLERRPAYSRAAFIASACNASALMALDAWPAWRGGALVLVGPAGSGKTHLAMAFAADAGAAVLPSDPAAWEPTALQGPLVLEDADGLEHGEALFHLINIAARPGCSLLLTARTPPAAWDAEIADLRSRLNALAVAELKEPDDQVLGGLLQKFFHERNIRPGEDLLAYLLPRIERSGPGARAMVARLDEAADARRRRISRTLAREVIDGEPTRDDEGEPD